MGVDDVALKKSVTEMKQMFKFNNIFMISLAVLATLLFGSVVINIFAPGFFEFFLNVLLAMVGVVLGMACIFSFKVSDLEETIGRIKIDE